MIQLFLLILLVFSVANCIPFEDCGSLYNLESVQIENCNYLPCPLFTNKETKVTVNMYSNAHSRSLSQNINIIMKTIYVEAEATPGPCTSSRPCPVKANTDASFTTNLHVPSLPPFPAQLQWELYNEYNIKVMCFRTSVQICDGETDDEDCYQI